ncbi:alpha-L-fucosidase [Paenibacillus sp. P26]|nr:alpha-L-fucosidase [Paenibacillus sp. P26]
MAEQEDLLDNAEDTASARSLAADEVSDSAARHDARMAWWREARVGLFIHWGLYSLPGGLWKGQEVKASYAEHLMLRAKIPIAEYETIATSFRAEHFDAKMWVRAAKKAGFRYLIFTAKHHDGFAMYDSSVSDYNIVRRSPFGRDPLQELAEACREEDVKLCIYYSHSMDWHHPDSQGNTWDYPGNIGAYDEVESWIGDEDKRTRYERYLHTFALPQVKEPLEKYGPVGLLWFDCGHKLTEEQGKAFISQVRQVQPDCLINRRVWKEPYGDYANTSDNQPHVRVPRKDWESIATLNDSWGYKATDHNWKPVEVVLRQLIDVVSQGGNFVVNVGPMGDGSFDPKSLELLERIGDWLRTNGDAVYGTDRSPLGKPPWGLCTIKGSTVYLHVFDWPRHGRLVVPGLRSRVAEAYLLADAERNPLPVRRTGEEDVVIDVPEAPGFSPIPVIAVELAGECDANPARRLFPEEYPNVFGAFDAEISGPSLRYDTGKKDRDNVMGWSSPADEASWRFRVCEPGSYKAVVTCGTEAQGTDGAAFELTLTVERRDQEVDHRTGMIRHSGGLYQFESYEIGSLTVPEAGEYTMKVRASAVSDGALLCLKQVVLEPDFGPEATGD